MLSRLQHDQRAVEAGAQLDVIVQMRVVHESPGTRRCEARDERFAGVDRRRNVLSLASPAGDTVVVALEFDAMPMDRRGFGETILNRNFDWLAAGQHDRRPWG